MYYIQLLCCVQLRNTSGEQNIRGNCSCQSHRTFVFNRLLWIRIILYILLLIRIRMKYIQYSFSNLFLRLNKQAKNNFYFIILIFRKYTVIMYSYADIKYRSFIFYDKTI